MMNALQLGVVSMVRRLEHERTSCPKVEAVLGLASRPLGKILKFPFPSLPSQPPSR